MSEERAGLKWQRRCAAIPISAHWRSSRCRDSWLLRAFGGFKKARSRPRIRAAPLWQSIATVVALYLNRRQWPCESEAPEQRRCDDAYIYAIEQTAHPAIKSKNLPYQTALDVVVAIGGTFLETTNSKGRCPLGMFVSNLEL